MRDLDRGRLGGLVLAANHQASVDKAGQGLVEGSTPIRLAGSEPREVDAAAGVHGLVVAGVDQPHEESASLFRLLHAEVHHELVGVLFQGADEAAHRLVHSRRERVPVALRPEAAKGVLEERKGAGLSADLLEDLAWETGRELEADPLGRAHQDVSNLLDAHPGDGDPVGLVVRHSVEAEAGLVEDELTAAAEEVDAQGKDDVKPRVSAREGPEPPGEGLPLGRVLGVGEELLELVDDEEVRPVGRCTRDNRLKGGERGGAGSHRLHDPGALARRLQAADVGHDAREDDGRLAGTRRAVDDDEAGPPVVDQRLHVAEGLLALRVATEKEAGVLGLKGAQAPVRAKDDGAGFVAVGRAGVELQARPIQV